MNKTLDKVKSRQKHGNRRYFKKNLEKGLHCYQMNQERQNHE